MKDVKGQELVQRATYRATLEALVAVAGTAPFFIISGADRVALKIRSIIVSGMTLTAVAYQSLVVSKYSTAPSGGTPSVATKVPTDSQAQASQATLCQGYTAAPTPGTEVGRVASRRVIGQATTPAAAGIPETHEVGGFQLMNESSPVVLRSAAENIGIRFSAAPASAVTMNIEIEWTEEAAG